MEARIPPSFACAGAAQHRAGEAEGLSQPGLWDGEADAQVPSELGSGTGASSTGGAWRCSAAHMHWE